jgi:hypothetical protein
MRHFSYGTPREATAAPGMIRIAWASGTLDMQAVAHNLVATLSAVAIAALTLVGIHRH